MTEQAVSPPPWAQNPFHMKGTEGTGEYLVLGAGNRTRLGIRELSWGDVRIRIEPADDNAAALLSEHLIRPSWKQPGDDDQTRFSMVRSGENGVAAVAEALELLKELDPTVIASSETEQWREIFLRPVEAPFYSEFAGESEINWLDAYVYDASQANEL